jgi:hypothetical protein
LKTKIYVRVLCALSVGLIVFLLFWKFVRDPTDINPRDSFNLDEAQRAQLAQAALKGDWKAATSVGMYWFMYKNKPGCGHAWFVLAERHGGPSGSNSALEHTSKLSNGVPEIGNCGPREAR